MPNVDILITTTGKRPCLEQAIISAQYQTYSASRVIVVQDGVSEASNYTDEIQQRPDMANVQFIALPTALGRGNMVKAWYLQQPDAAEYVKFLDDDDWIAPSCLSTMMQAVEAQPDAALCLCQMLVLYAPKGIVLRSRIHPADMVPGIGSGQSLVRTSAAVGIPYHDVPDGDFYWLREIAKHGPVVAVSHPLYVYNAYRTNAERGPFADV